MRTLTVLLLGTLLALALSSGRGVAQSAAPAIATAAAVGVFAEAKALCTAEGATLWGVSLCGPMMFVDAATRQAIGNRATPGATHDGTLYRFTLPADVALANTSFDFGGTRWTMILWPLPDDARERAVELMHESYHRIQPQLGLVGSGGLGVNGHLDNEAGRIWLRGELHALTVALTSTGDARGAALRDALLLRAYRHALFAGSTESENRVEINEGLAESTGIAAGLPAAQRVAYAIHDLASVEAAPSYVRQFPYGTGPAYVALLDAVDTRWRRSITQSSDLSALAGAAYGIQFAVPDAAAANSILARYGGAAILTEEASRAASLAARTQLYNREFVAGPTLALPMRHFMITFSPRAIEQFGEHGSVYHTLHITDDWGAIDVAGGDALINSDFNLLTVGAPKNPTGSTLSGTGWTLKLAPGYSAIADPAHPANFHVAKSPA